LRKWPDNHWIIYPEHLHVQMLKNFPSISLAEMAIL
jgi:hypothetical protein